MNKRIRELGKLSRDYAYATEVDVTGYIDPNTQERLTWFDLYERKFAELIMLECAKELREAEQEADRAYKAKEVKERNTFDGYDFADMLEERFGVEQ